MDTPRETHSAVVRAQLAVNGHVFEVAQLGPGYLFLKDPIDLPPSDAVLTLQIDDSVSVRNLRLPCGMAAGRQRTLIAAANAGSRAAG
jgi:hypothetical protein